MLSVTVMLSATLPAVTEILPPEMDTLAPVAPCAIMSAWIWARTSAIVSLLGSETSIAVGTVVPPPLVKV